MHRSGRSTQIDRMPTILFSAPAISKITLAKCALMLMASRLKLRTWCNINEPEVVPLIDLLIMHDSQGFEPSEANSFDTVIQFTRKRNDLEPALKDKPRAT
ncbi:hypothetical protein BOTBODRAFT_494699 [Botryobasidium botryosum FD-172 SS1]|uniref:Uncharacterized protein n=1 Tax=Botryobasidium botryosum (strain FD-172 SS1) TaxID=930990 RepID=A0A067MEU9_BOTB1|nr:hypothetical protein BOTBODRAFT_494699 [Botryobasidium botryosum FD-172 SS1]